LSEDTLTSFVPPRGSGASTQTFTRPTLWTVTAATAAALLVQPVEPIAGFDV